MHARIPFSIMFPVSQSSSRPVMSFSESLRAFPRRATLIALVLFLSFVPLAYSPRGAEFDGLFDDFYYQPKLSVGLILLAVAAVFYFAALARKRASFVYSPVMLYAGIFLAALAVATILSPYPKLAFWGRRFRSEGLLAFIMYVGAFFLFAICADSLRRAKACTWAACTGASLASLYGILQFFGLEFLPRDAQRADWWRPFATSGNPDFLSAYLLLVLPFPVIFFLLAKSENGRKSWLWLVPAGLMFSCILATYHRGAWVGLAAGVVVSILLLRKVALAGCNVSPVRVIALAAVFLACGLVIDRSAAAMGRPSLLSRAAAGTDTGEISESTIHVRTYVNRATLPLILQRPAFGWGLATMHVVFPVKAKKPEELGYSGRLGSVPDKPENLLLQVAYEGGLASLAPFVITIGLFLITMWRAVGKLEAPGNILAIAILTGCISYLAQQQFSFSTLSTSPVFWSLMGLGLALAARAGGDSRGDDSSEYSR